MTDLLERINWIKDATSGKDLGVSQLTSFYIVNGYIHASDGRMVVGTPFPFPAVPAVMVPAEPFIRILANKPDGEYAWELETDRLVLHRGRFKGKVKLLDPAQWPYPLLEGNQEPIPDGLVESLEALLPFVSENAVKPWATCFMASGNHIWASNNIAVGRATCPQVWPNDEPLLIPRWIVEFITHRQAGLDWWYVDTEKNQISFGWEDGSWMRSSTILDKYPNVESVFDANYVGDEWTPIEPAWRQALARVARITGDPLVRLRPDGVYGAGGEAVLVEDDATTPVPAGEKETIWDMRFLEPVIDLATEWNPCAWPKPAPWRRTSDGVLVEGIILGRRDP